MSLQDKDPLNIVISGVGGQGNVTISRLIGQAMVDTGHNVTVGETYGAAQRGGAVVSNVRISRDASYGPLIPTGQVDICGSSGPTSVSILRSFSCCISSPLHSK